MTYPLNYKTVVVLDHGPKFLQSSNEPFEFELINKSKAHSNPIPLAAPSKSHWTCSIEAGLEFCRIIYDIFGRKKLVSFITSSLKPNVLTGWSESDQDLEKIQKLFGGLGLPKKIGKLDGSSEPLILQGLSSAIDQLLTPTPKQTDTRLSLREDADRLENNGRIVCITMARNDTHLDDVIEKFRSMLDERNRIAQSSDEYLPIHSCELVLVLPHAVGSSCKVTSRKMYEASSNLKISVIVTESGRNLANKMVSLAVTFFNLVITAVTGIPMKEEQNASSSANYDVELLHSSEAHSEMLTELADGCKAPSQEIEGVDSVTLKWCTPKSSSSNDIHFCVGAFPISPVDASSRPSLCLTTFLLNGRSVMLEQPRRSGCKILSHMLTSHGGQIYIHLLATGKSILDDPPSISEGVGGRVTDYRIQAFGELMKEHSLVPVRTAGDGYHNSLNKSIEQLERSTRFWPMTIGETMICNLQTYIDPLVKRLVKQHLTEQDIHECQQSIFQLMRLENENLLAAYSAHKAKRKEEHARQLWSELEDLIQSHSGTSSEHAKVLEILNNCKPSQVDISHTSRKKRGSLLEKSEEVLTTTVDSAKEPSSGAMSQSSSPLPVKRSKLAGNPFTPNANQSLLSMWTSYVNNINNSRHREFSGRLNSSGRKSVLYQKFEDAIMDPVDDITPGVKSCLDH